MEPRKPVISILMTGVQGSGKSLLAREIYRLAADMNVEVVIETSNDGVTFEVEEP